MRVVLIVGVLLILIGGLVDLWLDQPEQWLSFHVMFELMMIAGALIFMTATWLGWWRAHRETVQLRAALAPLSATIERQLGAWQLTPAERDVALLLLRGHSHKRIASESGRSERTVRQHAIAVYHKAGVSSRAELAAFFLDAGQLPGAGH